MASRCFFLIFSIFSTRSTQSSLPTILPSDFIRLPPTMANHLERYESYACCVRRMLFCAGLWPGPVSSKLFRFVAFIHILTALFTSSGIMYFVVSHITNLSLVTKGLGIAVSFFTIIVKVIVFLINRDYLVELHEILDTTFRKDLAIPELQPILLSPLEYFYRPTLWFSLATWTLVCIYYLTPMISIITQRAYGVTPIKYRTPFPTQYPWIVAGNSVLYPTHYFIEFGADIAVGSVTAGTDALFGFYIFQMVSQFRTLSYRMANAKISDDYHTVVKECVNRHQILTVCRNKLQTIYGPIVLWMLMTSAMIICTNIFQASQMSFDKGMLVLVYILMKLMQTLLYAWYGLFLTTESEAFRESIYFSGWPNAREKPFLSNILILLMYKPLVLKACHCSVISLDMFIAISNTALSYFFLLRTLDESK